MAFEAGQDLVKIIDDALRPLGNPQAMKAPIEKSTRDIPNLQRPSLCPLGSVDRRSS
jgi:hypothetical protein